MAAGKHSALDAAAIATEIVASRKYNDVHADTIERAARAALRTNPKRLADAVHYAKEKLHQWCAAYRDGELAKLERRLGEVDFTVRDGSPVREFAREAMALHASTAERLAEIDAISAALREESAGATSVIDLCGGAAAFALPWIALPETTRYSAFDIDGRFVRFANAWLARWGGGTVEHRDVLAVPPDRGDVAWLLKSAPCLERQESGGVVRLLRAISAPRVIVSFPTRSLGGRDKGMAETYERFATELATALDVGLRPRAFDSETLYVFDRERRE